MHGHSSEQDFFTPCSEIAGERSKLHIHHWSRLLNQNAGGLARTCAISTPESTTGSPRVTNSRICDGRTRNHSRTCESTSGNKDFSVRFYARCPTHVNHRAPSCSSLGGGVHVAHMESGRRLPRPGRRMSPSRRDCLLDTNETPLLADGGVLQHVGRG